MAGYEVENTKSGVLAAGRVIMLMAAPLAAGACALPVPIQIAYYAGTGVSYLATEKSLTDHGISAAFGQDCAMHRALTEGQACRDDAAGGTAVAEVEHPAESESAAALVPESTEFETAAGPAPVDSVEFPAPVAAAAEAEVEISRAEKPPAAAAPKVTESGPGGLYYVLASFAGRTKAEQFASENRKLSATVATGSAGGRSVYRVVVGPVDGDKAPAMRTRIHGAGFTKTWSYSTASAKPNPVVPVRVIASPAGRLAARG